MLLTRAGRSATGTGWDSNAHALVRDWFPDGPGRGATKLGTAVETPPGPQRPRWNR